MFVYYSSSCRLERINTKTMTTLNKKASQLLDELLTIWCRGESEKSWIFMGTRDTEYMLGVPRGATRGLTTCYNAYNLQELITILPQILLIVWERGVGLGAYKDWEYEKIHRILDIYIKDGMEGVSNYLIDMVKRT